jgi:hypothetical protein
VTRSEETEHRQRGAKRARQNDAPRMGDAQRGPQYTPHPSLTDRAIHGRANGAQLFGNERTFIFYATNLEGVRRSV